MRKAKSSPGIVVRHARSCEGDTNCTCKPTFQAWTWDKRAETIDPETGEKIRGKKIRKTFPTISAAKQWRQDAGGEVKRGTLRASSRVKLEDGWAKWLKGAEAGEILSRFGRPYKDSTLRGYRADADRYFLHDFGAILVDDLRRRDVQGLVERLNGKGLSGQKVRNVVVALQSFYRWADQHELTTVDPTVNLALPKTGGRRERVVQPSDAARLLAALPDDDRAVWATAFYGGLRRGELRALRVSDVQADRISVEHSWDDYTGQIDPKSRAGVRVVPLPATLAAILEAHSKRTKRKGDELLFGRTPTRPFTPTHLADVADQAWKDAKLDRVTLHEARHSYGSYLDAAGVSETRSARYLGHSLEAISDRYRHALPGQLADDAQKLDLYLVGAASGKVVSLPTGAQTGAQAVRASR